MNQMAPPVFIIGIMERSGTNFLADALQLLDPNLQLPRVLGEDFLLEHSNLLSQYADLTYQRWKGLPWLESPENCKQQLFYQLGEALLRVLYSQIDFNKRLLTKTPNASNVDKFFQLFPQAKLLILVRDGRDVVESALATWSYEPFEHWITRWADGARSILEFMRGHAGDLRGSSWELVRYEDLLNKPQQVVDQLATFLQVERRCFDWHQIEHLPIRGSSQNRDGAGGVDWTPVEKFNGFKPLRRWSGWGWRQKRQFKKLAGRELTELGYVSNNNW